MMVDLPPALWERVMVIAPHPDDETLATGGLLQQAVATGAAVRVIFATDGDNNPWPQRVSEHHWRISHADRARWGERRRGEALAALAMLGVSPESVCFLGYPDQGLTQLFLRGSDALLGALASEIATWHPTLLVTPSIFDLHPDHNALAVLLRLAQARMAPSQRRFVELTYRVHGRHRMPGQRDWFHVSLQRAEQARKRVVLSR